MGANHWDEAPCRERQAALSGTWAQPRPVRAACALLACAAVVFCFVLPAGGAVTPSRRVAAAPRATTATITVSPASGPVRSAISLTPNCPTGYTASGAYGWEYVPTGLSVQLVPPTQVPTWPVAGTYTISTTCNFARPTTYAPAPVTATGTFTVTEPTIDLSPASGIDGSSFALSAYGFSNADGNEPGYYCTSVARRCHAVIATRAA